MPPPITLDRDYMEALLAGRVVWPGDSRDLGTFDAAVAALRSQGEYVIVGRRVRHGRTGARWSAPAAYIPARLAGDD
jgi:hypothetical protein